MTSQKIIESSKEAKTLIDNCVKPIGQLNEKYGIMVFKSKPGNYSIVKRIVTDYVIKSKKIDPYIIVMEDIDDNLVKTWMVGNIQKISEMVNDELKTKS